VVNATTVFEGAANLAVIPASSVVEVSGFPNPDGSITASRVEVKNSSEYKLRGTVSNLAAGSFTLGVTPALSYTVNFTPSMVVPNAGSLVNGASVKVKCSSAPSGSVLTASKVSVQQAGLEDSQQAEVEGIVSSFNSSQKTFSLQGISVNASSLTLPSGFADGAKVEVKGALSNGMLTATSLKQKKESDKEIKGTVSAKTDTTFTINGTVINVTPTTIYRDGSSKSDRMISFASIAINDNLQVEGYQDSGGAFTATRLERETSSGDKQTVSQGVITAFGSVYVNGVKYDTGSCGVIIDDSSSSTNNLKVGMVVRIKGLLSSDGVNGKCSSIEYEDSLEGIAANVVANGFSVLGQNVTIDATTVYEGFANFAAMPVNALVEVSGFKGADGSIAATRVELKTSGDYKIRGIVSNLGSASFDLAITPTLTYTVNFASAAILPSASGLVNGAYVKVKTAAAPVGTTITATQVSVKQAKLDDSAHAEVEGLVASYDSAAKTFTINGITVNASALTLPAGFADGIKVEVEGSMANGTMTAVSWRQEKDSNLDIKGAVSAKDATTLTVNGITITVSPTTIYKDDSSRKDQLLTLATILVNDTVEVKGLTDSAGTFIATKIERK